MLKIHRFETNFCLKTLIKFLFGYKATTHTPDKQGFKSIDEDYKFKP